MFLRVQSDSKEAFIASALASHGSNWPGSVSSQNEKPAIMSSRLRTKRPHHLAAEVIGQQDDNYIPHNAP